MVPKSYVSFYSRHSQNRWAVFISWLDAGLSCWSLALLLVGWKLLTLPAPGQSNYAFAYTFTTFAGVASTGNADGVGTSAQFNYPYGIATDTNGNLYVADTLNHTIRKISSRGVVSTIAGFPGNPGSADGPGQYARFFNPSGVALDNEGNLYVADTGNNTIRKLQAIVTNWSVTTIAGVAGSPPGTNDGSVSMARFNEPTGLTVAAAGDIYVCDTANSTIRKIINGFASTIAGLPGQPGTKDGAGGVAQFNGPEGITLDSAGNLYVADTTNHTVRQVSPIGSSWEVSTIAGTPRIPGSLDGPGGFAHFFNPEGIAVDTAGNLYVADHLSSLIRVITPAGMHWSVSTLAGKFQVFGNVDGSGTNAVFDGVRGITIDSQGNLYVTDQFSSSIRSITSAGVVNTLAGAARSAANVNGTASDARFYTPYGTAVDSSGNVYVADSGNAAIRKISSAGLVTTLAGTLTGLKGIFGTNDGVGSDAHFNFPQGLAVDAAGTIYVADTYNHTIRAVTPAGVVTTIAGSPQNPGANDGPAYLAQFNHPHTIALGSSTNMFVTDSGNRMIRQLTLVGTNWNVRTIAGSPGLAGTNDGPGNAATFDYPIGIAADSLGNVYVSEYYQYTIRKLTPMGTNWIVSTIAGSAGKQGTTDGLSSVALFYNPYGLALDGLGALYVAEGSGCLIRKVNPAGTDWSVSTIAGLPGSLGSADGAGSAARFAFPAQIAVDKAGTLYVSDRDNDTIRKGVFSQYTSTNPVPRGPSSNNGQLMLTLLPPEANGQWRLPWELGWRKSGTIASNLAVDNSHPNYTVEVRSLPGWLAFPSSFPATVTGNGVDSITTNVYYPTISLVNTNTAGGTLTVNLGANPPSGAGWRFLGDGGTNYFPSGYATNLLPGTYLIEFAGPFTNRATPSSLSVDVLDGQPTVISVNYLLAQAPPAGVLLPQAVLSANIGDLTDYPFGFNGQLKTDVGYGSGVAVQSNVVLTAAHLVFNDQTRSYVSHAFWYFQRQAGAYEPTPMEARGWYVLSGYASQRTNDLNSGSYGPDQSTAQSRNLDVAALYFSTPAAGGGYGGYLPSDEVPNSWLSSTSLKMLLGYPVDGSVFGDTSIEPGVMYQTTPQPYPLSQSSDQVDDQQVYVAPWLLSYPGNSGGALYVQFNGYYYPAGVYLGTLYNGIIPAGSFVRAIDSNVVNLITRAQEFGDAGTNNTGGGVITIVPVQGISGKNLGHIRFHLGPPAAVQAGAGWKLHTDPPDAYGSDPNYTLAVDSTNDLQVEFKPIAGWNLPTNQTVRVFPGPITTNYAFYTMVTNLPVTITSGLVANSRVYDGTAAATLSSNNVVLGGVLPGDVPNVALSTNGYIASFASASVGTNKTVTVSGLSLTGSAAPNYTLVQPPLKASITAAPVMVQSGLVANDRKYDGTTAATLSSNNVVLGGVVPGEAAKVALSTNGYSASFASATVGTAKTVTVNGLTLAGSAAPNYVLTPPSLRANITQAQLDATADNKTRVVGTTNPPFTGVITGLQNGDQITLGFTCSATVSSPPGQYPIIPVLSDTNNVLANYVVVIQDGFLTVTLLPNRPILMGTSLIGQTLSVSVSSATGIVYVLESKPSLSDLLWAQVDQQTGTGNTIILHDNGAVGGVRFYRIRAHP